MSLKKLKDKDKSDALTVKHNTENGTTRAYNHSNPVERQRKIKELHDNWKQQNKG